VQVCGAYFKWSAHGLERKAAHSKSQGIIGQSPRQAGERHRSAAQHPLLPLIEAALPKNTPATKPRSLTIE
jgi:hypothetical protein